MSRRLEEFQSIAKSLEGSLGFAIKVEDDLNKASGDQPGLSIKRAIDILDGAVAPTYLHGDVALAGLYQIAQPNKVPGPEGTLVRSSLAEGVVEGRSYGFTVVNVAEQFAPKETEDDEDQTEIYRRILSANPGPLAVCHLVTHAESKFGHPSNLYSNNLTYRAVGPVRTSTLIPTAYSEARLAVNRLAEIDRIFSSLPPAHRKYVKKIEAAIAPPNDPLEGLIVSARKARHVMSESNWEVAKALVDYLNILTADTVLNSVYTFDELPVCLVKNDTNRLERSAIKTNPWMGVVLKDLSVNDYYIYDKDGQIKIDPHQRALYMEASMVVSPHGGRSFFSIPIEQVAAENFARDARFDPWVGD